MRRPKRQQLCLLILALAACQRPPAVTESGPRHDVRVDRDETVLTAFSGSGGTALIDGDHLSIELTSPDESHRLAVEVDGNTPGVYPLVPAFETTKAVVVLITRGTPTRVSPSTGKLQLTAAADGRRSGHFEGAATDSLGHHYIFRGSFADLPVKRL